MRSFLALLLVLLVFLAGCHDDQKKAAPSAPRAPEPIPSDFVVNGFFGGGATDITVRDDSGVPALPVSADGGAAAQPGAVASAPPAAGSNPNVKVLEPGEEPRAARKYELKAGRTESLAITLKSTMSQEVGGAMAGSGAQPGMVFSLALTPQGKAPSGDTDIKVIFAKAEVLPTPEADPMQSRQLGQAFKMLAGQGGTFRLGPHGAISNFRLASDKLAQTDLAAIAQQTLEGIFITLPDEPIGKGAKWEESATTHQEGVSTTMTSSYTLKDIGADGLTIAMTTTRKASPQQLADPRAPKGTTVAVDGTANGQLKIRLDRMPMKGTIESNTAITVNQPPPPGSPPKTVVQKVSMKQTIDNSTP